MASQLKARTFEILDNVVPGDKIARAYAVVLMVVILLNIVSVAMSTVPDYEKAYGQQLRAVEALAIFCFLVDYILRLWACTSHAAEGPDHRILRRLKYTISPLGLIDLLAVLPTFAVFVGGSESKYVTVLRLLCLLKVTRYSPALDTIGAVVFAQRKGLSAAALLIAILMMFSSGLIYLAEFDAQSDKFGNLLDAMWWAVVTIATVGYGDLAPITPLGRLVGAMTIMLGIVTYALPTGLLASGFADEIRKRDFVVTWRLVAKVPFFAQLDAGRIAQIAGLLEPKHIHPGYTVFSRGEAADCMYFLASGEVDVMLAPHPIRLRAGDFFGEIALLKDTERTAGVVAATECHLLTLNVIHFKRLLAANPDLKAVIDKVAEERLGQKG